MLRKVTKIFIILCSLLCARDLYVSKSALAQYETDDYLLFDRFNDSLEAPHKTHPNYNPAKDAVDLGENGPILGPNFTQEAWIYRPGKQPDPAWGLIMGYSPLVESQDTSDSPTRAMAGQDSNKEAPFIWKFEENGIRYGFGSGDRRNYVNVDSVLMNIKTWYHVATTFNGTDYKLYVNGEEVNNRTIGGGRVPYPTPVRYIGGARVSSGRFFGKIDEVRMWDFARTQEEIQETMTDTLTGNEPGLVAYYPMDIHNEYLLDRSGNNYHGIMIGPMIKSRYFSDDCPEPDGSMDCPYPTIETALEDVQAWDRIIIRGGRYTEFIMNEGINWNNPVYNWNDIDPDFGGPPTNTITIEPYLNENVVIDGTVSIDVDWEPYSHNGHSVFRAVLDSAAIANEIQRPFRDVYGVWIDDRYQIPALVHLPGQSQWLDKGNPYCRLAQGNHRKNIAILPWDRS